MAVICDTTKVALRRNGKYWMAYIKGLKNRNGKKAEFVITSMKDDPLISDAELYVMFFEKLEAGKFKTSHKLGSETLFQDEKGNYYLAKTKRSVGVSEASAEKLEKAEPKKVEPKPTVVAEIAKTMEASKVSVEDVKRMTTETIKVEPVVPSFMAQTLIADPTCQNAKVLLNHMVDGSDAWLFPVSDTVRGELVKICPSAQNPFIVKDNNGELHHKIFIRPQKIAPVRLADPEVRRTMRGRWVVSKAGGSELMLTRFANNGAGWTVNGLSASQLMNLYTWDDGSPIVDGSPTDTV